MTDVKPVQFGKYILLDKIAVGGMAELYRAKITGVKGFEKLIAIKKILSHLTAEDVLISAFIDEAKLAAFLQHQNIVQIYDFGSMENAYFIAMEYLLGKDLRLVTQKSKQTDHPLSLENALHITARICDGLYYAHNLKDFHEQPLNIIHRDIGPHNIFITYDGQVKVIDFGIAKAASQSTSTRDGLIKGKVAYMSPEQARGKAIDHRADIYSIGILLYELVTSKRMFTGDTLQVYAKACKAEFEPAQSLNKNLPTDLYAILDKALAKDLQQRYQSADEMASDLDKCISGLSHRPSARSLSVYMKALFEQEFKTEEHDMREAALHDSVEVSKARQDPAEEHEETILLDTKDAPEKSKRHTFLYAVLGLAYIVCLAAITLTFFNRPVEEPSIKKAVIASLVSGPDELTTAEALMKEERFAQAVVLFEDILEKKPSMQDRVKVPYSRALQGLAVKIKAHDGEKAKKLLLKSIQTSPDNAGGHYQLGRIYTKQKNYPSAIVSYKLAAELDPEMAVVFFNLGYIYYAVNKNYSQAYAMYQHAVELSPPFLDEALFNLALVQNKLGKRQESIKSLERAISINPENKQAQKFLEYVKRKQK